MIHVFREKEFFYLFLVPSSWSVSQSPIRVVIIIIMDHSYNNNNKWRLHAIFSDPRVWIKGGSTMDQHGSTWIKCLQLVAFSLSPSACRRRGSCVMAHASHASGVLTHGSCVMRHASHSRGMRPDSWLMRPASHASGSWLMRQASGVRLMRQASGVRRQASHSRGMRHGSRVMRQASGVESIQPPHSAHSAHSAAACCRP